MNTVVTQSRTVVPLPATIVGQTTDESGNTLHDEFGNPIIARGLDAILDAIYAVAAKLAHFETRMHRMSDQITQIEGAIATLVASDAVITASEATTHAKLDDIKAMLLAIQPGQVMSASMLQALIDASTTTQAAAVSAQENAATATAMATPATPPTT